MESHLTIPQDALIRDMVCSFWQLSRNNFPSVEETIVPKGIVEMIFNLETPKLYVQLDSQSLTIPRCFIQGFHTHPIQLSLTGKQLFFGVVLKPASVKYLFNLFPVLLANSVIDLTLVDSSFYSLWQRIVEQKNFNNRITVFSDWLTKKYPQLNDRENAFNNFLTSTGHTNSSVSELAKEFCYSTRQLSRKLYELTGMNIEQVLLYKKYLQSLYLIHHSKLSLTEIAYTCQFADQSHFTKTFRSLCLCTPKEYRQKKSDVVGHIFKDVC